MDGPSSSKDKPSSSSKDETLLSKDEPSLQIDEANQPQLQVASESRVGDTIETASSLESGALDATHTPDIRPPQGPPVAGFIPTNEWLDSWKRYLPLDNILRIITTLSPQIQSLCTGNTTDEVNILEFLQRSTLVGLLPVPHPILIR